MYDCMKAQMEQYTSYLFLTEIKEDKIPWLNCGQEKLCHSHIENMESSMA